MRGLLSILLFSFFSQLSQAQPVEDHYNQWLSSSPLGGFLVAEEYNESKGELVLLTDDGQSSPDDVRRQYATWDSLYVAQKKIGIDVIEQLMLVLSLNTGRSIDDLSITIRSAIPVLFSVVVTSENGLIKSRVDYVDDKGRKTAPYVLSVGGFDPKEHFIFKWSLKEAQTETERVLKDFFKSNYKVKSEQVQKNTLSVFQTEYLIASKALITSKYFERIIITFSYISIEDGGTEVIYYLRGEYASGIIEPGDFRDLKSEYFEELMTLNKNLKETLYKSEKGEG